MVDPDNVVRFPFKERANPAVSCRRRLRHGEDQPAVAVEHDGRVWAANRLMRELPPHSMREVGAMAPCTLQAFWDEVVRRRPAMADEIVVRVGGQGV